MNCYDDRFGKETDHSAYSASFRQASFLCIYGSIHDSSQVFVVDVGFAQYRLDKKRRSRYDIL